MTHHKTKGVISVCKNAKKKKKKSRAKCNENAESVHNKVLAVLPLLFLRVLPSSQCTQCVTVLLVL